MRDTAWRLRLGRCVTLSDTASLALAIINFAELRDESVREHEVLFGQFNVNWDRCSVDVLLPGLAALVILLKAEPAVPDGGLVVFGERVGRHTRACRPGPQIWKGVPVVIHPGAQG